MGCQLAEAQKKKLLLIITFLVPVPLCCTLTFRSVRGAVHDEITSGSLLLENIWHGVH